MADEERRTRKTKQTEWSILGKTVISRSETEDFNIKQLPGYVQEELKKSRIPREHFENALAVVGRSFGKATTIWADRMSDSPELNWRAPSPPDFNAALTELRQDVSVDALTIFSKQLFGRTNTPDQLIGSINREIEILFEKHDRKSKVSS